jgi:hypothetical protein
MTFIAVVALVLCFLGPLWPLAGGWIGGAITRQGNMWGLAGVGTAYAALLIAAHAYNSVYPSLQVGGYLGPEVNLALSCGALVGWFGGLMAWAFTFDNIP